MKNLKKAGNRRRFGDLESEIAIRADLHSFDTQTRVKCSKNSRKNFGRSYLRTLSPRWSGGLRRRTSPGCETSGRCRCGAFRGGRKQRKKSRGSAEPVPVARTRTPGRVTPA